jgi:hypothetical protein
VQFFAESVIIPLLREGSKKSVLEIGSSYGSGIKPILELGDVRVSIIDPGLDADLQSELGQRVTLHQGLSLEILPLLEDTYDCIFIDGDHNWYTVFNELKVIDERKLLNQAGVIFLHDIAWPYGRRDMYYQPETIPREFRNPHAAKGIQRGQSMLIDEGGLNAPLQNALEEFGPRNGVLTAVEDFLDQSGGRYYFIKDPREFGLGILLQKSGDNDWTKVSRLRLRIFMLSKVRPKLAGLGRRVARLGTARNKTP